MNPANTVITVSELNRRARLAIEKSLPSSWIAGEISNLARLSSGHWYFTLKDEQCGVKCAFFRNRSQFIDWKPSEGDSVEVRAQATLYEPRGDFQLIIDMMRRAGQGGLYEEFLKLKARLEIEGLFSAERKKHPPKFIQRLGIVTSLQAAALQDVLKTLAGKWPLIEIIIYPCTVQGSEAASAIGQALRAAISRNECEVILLVRGGGSLEDLSPFNDENLARTIASSHIPIISGIGHETDFSIADFVADIRASTPTAAAQIAVPESVDIVGQISSSRSRIETLLIHTLHQRMQHLDGLTRRVTNPVNVIAQHRNNLIQLAQRIMFSHSNIQTRLQQKIDKLIFRFYVGTPTISSYNREVQTNFKAIKISFKSSFERRRVSLHTLMESLNQLNPERILSRGYCIARTIEGNVIKEAKSLAPGQQMSIQVRDGNILGTIDQVVVRSSTESDAQKPTPRFAGRW